jgi:hypothetical protein
MEAIRIKPTDDSPLVILDRETGQFEISGKSMPEDILEFYQPILEWLQRYQSDPLENTIFNMKMEYFNTASSKLLFHILTILKKIHDHGHNVLIRWHSPDDDEDIQEAGQQYAQMVDIDFEFVLYED